MDYKVVPIHHHPQYFQECCDLINSEWKRSNTARMMSLKSSCDTIPVSLILLQNTSLLGHLKMSCLASIKKGCFVESVVIKQSERGKGLGTILMKEAEKYAKDTLGLTEVYLSTQGQEGFYEKLGYKECEPVSIYGGGGISIMKTMTSIKKRISPTMVDEKSGENGAPKPPPIPSTRISNGKLKTYMKKHL